VGQIDLGLKLERGVRRRFVLADIQSGDVRRTQSKFPSLAQNRTSLQNPFPSPANNLMGEVGDGHVVRASAAVIAFV
jgi:hypothetical protein